MLDPDEIENKHKDKGLLETKNTRGSFEEMAAATSHRLMSGATSATGINFENGNNSFVENIENNRDFVSMSKNS